MKYYLFKIPWILYIDFHQRVNRDGYREKKKADA